MSGGRTDSTQHDFPDELVRHRPALERSARRLCRNRQDAEDLVQTTLVRAWQARAQFLPGGNFGGWLFRILSNHHRDTLRRRSGVQVPLPDEVPDPAPVADELSSLLTMAPEAALKALSQLPPELRAPLELRAASACAALDRWEGRPASYKLERLEILRRELGDVAKTVDVVLGKDARTLDDELKSHKLAPLPSLSALDRGGDGHGDGLDEPRAFAFHCAATHGQDCGSDGVAAATEERD